MTVTITVPYKPVSKLRPRFTSRGYCYTPKKTETAESFFQNYLYMHIKKPVEVACELKIIFHLKRPRSAKNRKYPSVKPDIDNYLKFVMDAANGILYSDDRLVVSVSACKIYSDRECCEIILSTLE